MARTASAIFCRLATQASLIRVCRLSGISTVSRFIGSAGASGFGFRLTNSSWVVTSLGGAIGTFFATDDLPNLPRQFRDLRARRTGGVRLQHCLAAGQGLSEPNPLCERGGENPHAIDGQRVSHAINGSIDDFPAYRKGGFK
jgi:hypothetical protein